jgi:V8-like Glu-specific endopeptidase
MARQRIGVAELPEPRVQDARGAAAALGAANFWTADMMQAAEPIPVPVMPAPIEPAADTSRSLAAAREGGAGVVLEAAPMPPDRPAVEPLDLASFDTTRVGDKFNQFPYSAIGKLFMVFGGKKFMGSAWVIGEKAFFTAGHCLFDHTQGGAASSIVFLGTYRRGQFTDQWTVVNKAVPNAWKTARDFRADMGVCIVDKPIRPVLGKLGFRANLSPAPSGPFTEVGYPGQPLPQFPFDGEEMWQSVGTFASMPMPISNGMGVMQAGGNLTGGCSGGPWADANDQFRAVGLNSSRLPNDVNLMNSPYFGDRFVELLNWMQQNGGDPQPPGG